MAELLRLHLLTASGRLLAYHAFLEQQISATFAEAAVLLELSEPVDVVVRDAPRSAIQEIGIGGFAPDRHTIFISIDPDHPNIRSAFAFDLARTVAHELDHIARNRSVGYGTTLWQAIITEGLADHFSVELIPGEPPPWSVALTGQALEAAIASAALEHDSVSYDHATWFFGKDPDRVPRWAGYSIGWEIVRSYLERHPGARVSHLVNLPAATFKNS